LATIDYTDIAMVQTLKCTLILLPHISKLPINNKLLRIAQGCSIRENCILPSSEHSSDPS